MTSELSTCTGSFYALKKTDTDSNPSESNLVSAYFYCYCIALNQNLTAHPGHLTPDNAIIRYRYARDRLCIGQMGGYILGSRRPQRWLRPPQGLFAAATMGLSRSFLPFHTYTLSQIFRALLSTLPLRWSACERLRTLEYVCQFTWWWRHPKHRVLTKLQYYPPIKNIKICCCRCPFLCHTQHNILKVCGIQTCFEYLQITV